MHHKYHTADAKEKEKCKGARQQKVKTKCAMSSKSESDLANEGSFLSKHRLAAPRAPE